MFGEHADAVANVLCERLKDAAAFNVVSRIDGPVELRFPKLRIAFSRASAGDIPALMFASTCISRCRRISRSISLITSSRCRKALIRSRRMLNHFIFIAFFFCAYVPFCGYSFFVPFELLCLFVYWLYVA
jgi:hypothetical protein